MKFNIVNINPKEVAAFFINKNICATTNKSLESPLLSAIDSLRKKIHLWFKYIKHLVKELEYENIYTIESQSGKLYGIAKVHKTNILLRSVFSEINTAEYGLPRSILLMARGPFLFV